MLKIKLIVLLLISLGSLSAQSILGLWEVFSVEVGNRTMTPQAKWVQFKDKGFVSGNGLLQNEAGTYDYEASTSELRFNDSLGLDDRYGAFKVKLSNSDMRWERVEDGERVIVILKRTQNKPLRPLDRCVGLWAAEGLDQVEQLFLSWTKNYRITFKDGSREQGVWYGHPHRAEIIFLPWDRNKESRSFKIETGPWEELLLRSTSDTAELHYFSRRKSF